MIRASQKIRAEVSTSTAEFSASKNQKNETYSSMKTGSNSVNFFQCSCKNVQDLYVNHFMLLW